MRWVLPSGKRSFNYATTYKSLEDIQKLLKKGKYLEIVDEFCHANEILWRGEIFIDKKGKRRRCGYFEFFFYLNDGADILYGYNS